MTVLTTAVSWGATTVLTNLATPKATPADAVSLSYESDPAHISGARTDGRGYVFPATAHVVGGLEGGCDGLHAWGTHNGGADLGFTSVQVVAQGRSDSAVLLTNLKVRVLSKAAPAPGIEARCESAGSVQFRTISVDLDAEPPKVTYKAASESTFGFTLNKGETETFIVTANTTKAAYRWVIDMEMVVDGQKTVATIGPSDGFATAAGVNKTFWSWNHESAWELQATEGYTAETRTVSANEPLPSTN
jgi:hypothetical protein